MNFYWLRIVGQAKGADGVCNFQSSMKLDSPTLPMAKREAEKMLEQHIKESHLIRLDSMEIGKNFNWWAENPPYNPDDYMGGCC